MGQSVVSTTMTARSAEGHGVGHNVNVKVGTGVGHIVVGLIVGSGVRVTTEGMISYGTVISCGGVGPVGEGVVARVGTIVCDSNHLLHSTQSK